MFLEQLIKKFEDVVGEVSSCDNIKQYDANVAGVKVTFFANGDGSNIIKVPDYSPLNAMYYSCVVGLLFEYFDILIDEVHIGNKVIKRHQIWKYYEKMCDRINYIDAKNQVDKIYFDRHISKGESIWDNLIEYAENNPNIDHEDLAEQMSDTLKEKLQAELSEMHLIKGVSPTKKLF